MPPQGQNQQHNRAVPGGDPPAGQGRGGRQDLRQVRAAVRRSCHVSL